MEQEFSLSQYLAVLRRQWRTIAITLAVTLLAAVIFSLVQPISYEGEAVLVAQPPKYAWRLDTSFQTIFEDLRLDRRSDYIVLVTDKALGEAMAKVVIEKLGDVLPPTLRDPKLLRRQVSVKNGPSRLLYLNASAPTAELAQKLTNTWAEVWVAEADARYGQGADQAKFAEELAQAQERLDKASAALREFRTRTGLALGLGGYMAALRDGTLAAGLPLLQQQLVLNNSQLADYRLALARVRMLRERAQEAQTKGEPFAVLPLEVLDTPLLVTRGQLTRSAVESMHNDMAQLLSALDIEEKALSTTVARLEAETAAIQAELAALLQEQSHLEREYALAEEAVRALQRKVTEIPIQQEVVGPPLMVLNPAGLPEKPATPNWPLNLAAGMLLGLLGGIMLALGWEFAHGTA